MVGLEGMSCFRPVAWPTGTRPFIPGCVATAEHAAVIADWAVSRAVSPSVGSSAELLQYMQHQASCFYPTLPFQTEKYALRVVELQPGLFQVPRLLLGYVPPVDIFAKRKGSCFQESVHHFFFHIEGFFGVFAFTSNAERSAYLAAFAKRTVPRDAAAFGVGHMQLAPEGWREAGELAYHGATYSIALLTPLALRAAVDTAPIKEVRAIDLVRRGMEIVRAGQTEYVFVGPECVGFSRRGRSYRLREPEAQPQSLGGYASHSEIVRRQIDPFGLGIIGTKTETEKQQMAGNLVSATLDRLGLKRSGIVIPTPCASSVTLCDDARTRITQIHRIIDAQADTTDFQAAFGRVQIGLDPWRYRPECAGRSTYLRFVSVHDEAGVPQLLVGANECLLHYQLLRMALGDNTVENALHLGDDSPLWGMVRGGVLELRYDADGMLSETKLVDHKMTVPNQQDPDGRRILIQPEEAAQLLAALQSGTI